MSFKLKNSWPQNGGRSLRSWIASFFQGTSKQRKEWLKRNGEVLLRERLAAFLGIKETFPLFSEQELKVATDNFNSTHIFDVSDSTNWNYYKGRLPDGRIVYVKRYTWSNHTERITKEIVILSHLNHWNVEKLIGCYLETEYPLLVCEFFSKRTLAELLVNAKDGSSFPWLTRLDIAIEVAGTFMYLHSRQKQSLYHHSFPSLPIVHESFDPHHIFLDDENRSIQLTDFTYAKLIKDEDKLQDQMLGVCIYTDREALLSRKLTPKSDVYSFGVLLAEMLAGRILIQFTFNWTQKVLEVAREDCLIEMVDRRIRNEAKVEHFINVGEIVCNCLKDKGEERPTMREVIIKLRQLRTNLVPTQ